MRNTVITRILYGIGVFLLTFLFLELFINGNRGIRSQGIAKATLPVVSFVQDGEVFNEVHGYVTPRNTGNFRADITPVLANKTIEVSVDPYGQQVSHMSFEVRDLTGNRLIQSGDVKNLHVLDGGITRAEITLENLYQPDNEYLLVVLLNTRQVESARYYSRIVYTDEDYPVKDVLGFITAFHRETFSKNNRSAIEQHLDTDTNTTQTASYADVNIHSDYEAVTWGGIDPVETQEPVWTFTDLQKNTYSVVGTYQVAVEGTQKTTVYRCEDRYTVRVNDEGEYSLRDFERKTRQVFDPSTAIYQRNQVLLGVTSDHLESMASEDRKSVAFVNDGALYAYKTSDRVAAYVFGFAETEDRDLRDLYPQSDIHLLRVGNEGDVDFLVVGYMNRGEYEGQVGIAEYTYDCEHHTIRRNAFVAFDGSAAHLRKQLSTGVYMNEQNNAYFTVNGTLYEIDTEASRTRVVTAGLESAAAASSDNGRLVAYQETSNGVETGNLVLLDLTDRSQRIIQAEVGSKLTPLGFFGEDLIYGITQDEDRVINGAGQEFQPMSHVKIVGMTLEELEDYHKDGYYISSCDIAEDQITLHRVQKAEDESGALYYQTTSDDQIVSGVANDNAGELLQQTDPSYGRIMAIRIDNITGNNIRYIRPQLSEAPANQIDAAPSQIVRYNVYGPYGLDSYSDTASIAVTDAAALRGAVTDNSGLYVWKNDKRSLAEVEDISRNENVQTTGNTVAECLQMIYDYEGNAQSLDAVVGSSMTAQEGIASFVRGSTVMDLSGCEFDQMLYYVSEYHPVMGMTDNQTAALIVGYSDYNVILYDPINGGRRVLNRRTAREIFESCGNRFIAYVTEEE